MNLSDDQKGLLNFCGILQKYHERDIKEFPGILGWMDSNEGKMFRNYEKDLILRGGYKAIEIGTLLERNESLMGNDVFVGSLIRFSDCLKSEEDHLSIAGCKSVFIEGFQEIGECPISVSDKYRIFDFIKNRYNSNLANTILQVELISLDWWTVTMREFLRECYIVVDCE